MPRRFIFWISVLCIAGSVWAFYSMASYASRGGEEAPLFSVRRYDPYGAAAFYELLKRRGANVSTLENSRIPADDSPDDSASILIQILDSSAAYVKSDIPVEFEHAGQPKLNHLLLDEWMKKGNTVIQFCAVRTDLMRVCGVPNFEDDSNRYQSWQSVEKLMRSGKTPDELNWTPDVATVLQSGAENVLTPVSNPTLSIHLPRELSNDATSTWTPLATSDASRTVMGVKKVGKGRLIVVSSPAPVLNGWINEEGNLAVILSLLGDADTTESPRILIDEWSHGFGHGGTIVALIARLGLLPVLVQFGLVILLFVWSSRGVYATPLEHKVRRRSSVEQVATLGHLYSQVLPADELKARTHREVRRRIADALGCRVSQLENRLAKLDVDVREKADGLLSGSFPNVDALTNPTEQHARCHRCGYNLFGNTSGVCPECGNRINTLDQQVHQSEATKGQAASNKRIETDMRRVLTQTFEFTRELKH